MRDDPIVEEVRKARDKHAARFKYDLNAIAADLRLREKKSQNKYVHSNLENLLSFLIG